MNDLTAKNRCLARPRQLSALQSSSWRVSPNLFCRNCLCLQQTNKQKETPANIQAVFNKGNVIFHSEN